MGKQQYIPCASLNYIDVHPSQKNETDLIKTCPARSDLIYLDRRKDGRKDVRKVADAFRENDKEAFKLSPFLRENGVCMYYKRCCK
jgi:hypothetical protein